MKKTMAFLLAVLLLAALTACGSKSSDNNKKADATPEAIEAAVAEAIGDGYLATVDVTEEEMLHSALNYLDLEKVKSYKAKQSEVTALNPDAVVIVECEDGYADEAVDLINESYANTVNYSRQYPFEIAKVEGARLYKVDNLVIYIIAGASADENSSEEDAAKLAAAEYQKIDDVIKGFFGSVPENLAVIPEADDNGGGHPGGLIGG